MLRLARHQKKRDDGSGEKDETEQVARSKPVTSYLDCGRFLARRGRRAHDHATVGDYGHRNQPEHSDSLTRV